MLKELFDNQTFRTFEELETYLVLCKLRSICQNDPKNFYVWKLTNANHPWLCIRCPSCKEYGGPADKYVYDGPDHVKKNPQPGPCPTLQEIEADKTGELMRYRCMQFRGRRGGDAACSNCGFFLSQYSPCPFLIVKADERYLTLKSTGPGHLAAVVVYARIVRA